MTITILQWNINGYRPQKEDFQILCNKHEPHIICLQETNLKNDYCVDIQNYSSYFKKPNTISTRQWWSCNKL